MSHSLLSREAGFAYVESLRTGLPFDASSFASTVPEIDTMVSSAAVVTTHEEPQIVLDGRRSWYLLFTQVETLEDLAQWEPTIPRYCECEPFYFAWKKDNPPGDLITFEWKYRLKSAVNEKLGRPNISIEAARAEWLQMTNPLPEGEGRVRGPRAA